MSVDDVIARHRARLDEHRRFLESSTSTEPPVSTDIMGAPPDSNNRKSQSRSAIENADFSPQPLKPQVGREPRGVDSSYLSASPPAAAFQQKRNVCSGEEMQHCPSAHNTTEEPRIQRKRDICIKQKQQQQKEKKAKAKEEVEMSGDLYMAGDYNEYADASRAASTPFSFFACIDVHEQIAAEEKQFAAQLRSAARYYIRRPDAMYIKSQRWLEGRERSRQQLQHEQALKSLDECSFHPNRHHHFHHHHPRQRSSQQQQEEEEENTPTNGYKLRPFSSSFITVRDEAGVSAHLERLREARRRRELAARRLRGGTAGTWNNRLTVPVAFVFGRRVANIPALRRPYTNAIPHNTPQENNDDAEKAGSTTTTTTTTAIHTNGTAAGAEEEEKEKEEVEEMEKKEEEDDEDMNRDTLHARRRATAAVGKTVSKLEKTIALLKDEMAEKDRMLLRQKSEILLLKRDLEVAKTTVRRLSLQDVAQGEWTDEVTPVREASVSDG